MKVTVFLRLKGYKSFGQRESYNLFLRFKRFRELSKTHMKVTIFEGLGFAIVVVVVIAATVLYDLYYYTTLLLYIGLVL